MKGYYLKKNIDFKRVYSAKRVKGNKNLSLFIKKNNLNTIRVGFTITKKVGNAVVRNKIKRRLREIFRFNFEKFKNDFDYVFVIKKTAKDISYKELENSFLNLLRKIR